MTWPVLKTYDADHLARIAMPLGGIGTGTVSLGGRGDLRDWELMSRPAKGFAPRNSFFALWTKTAGDAPVTRAIEGPVDASLFEGPRGCRATNHGWPRFRQCSFAAAYPLAQVMLRDRDVPVDVRIEAFNPCVPGDLEKSQLPVAALRFVLRNRTRSAVDCSVCGSVQNFVGAPGKAAGRLNTFQQAGHVRGVHLQAGDFDRDDDAFGSLALTTTSTRGVTHRTAWADVSWGDTLLDFWEDFSEDGRLEEREMGKVIEPMASLAVSLRLKPVETRSVTFLLCWHFPNRRAWGSGVSGVGEIKAVAPNIGNAYTVPFSDAWAVARHVAANLDALEDQTVTFVRSFCSSDLPHPIKEAALFNLSTLRSQTCFRDAGGRFLGWEGCGDTAGCCWGSANHVWAYEQATGFLFAPLSKSMCDTTFTLATEESGRQTVRVGLPLAQASTTYPLAAADGQMGAIVRLFRDWQLSGDDEFLKRCWSGAKRAMAFCWQPGGWDADQDGVMEGCQHNTMDVEYFGPNPQMGGWYLTALLAAERMALHMSEGKFAAHCRDLFTRGSRWLDDHLFNGEYYEHRVNLPPKGAAVPKSLWLDRGGPQETANPPHQLAQGCLVDQLVGQLMAHICGFGHVLNAAHVRKTLASIMRYNFKPDLWAHFNHFRTFALQDEAALVMAGYPKGKPPRPFPYFNEVMTGFEYTAAIHMLYEGLHRDGMRCITAIRDRYDGRKRSPFNEAECGHHYARAMVSWAGVLALTGFHYSAQNRVMTFASPAANKTTWFWSTGSAWGDVTMKRRSRAICGSLHVLGGALHVDRIEVRGVGACSRLHRRKLRAQTTVDFTIAP